MDRGGRRGSWNCGRGGESGRGRGGESGRGRGGFRGGRGPRPSFIDPNGCPDPYSTRYSQDQLEQQRGGWKPCSKRKDNVVLQKYAGKPATWALQSIDVSVNHFPVESTKGKNSFGFPTLYHYDINYEIVRKRLAASGPEVKEGSPQKKKMSLMSEADSVLDDVESVTIELKGVDIGEKKRIGETPVNNKLPKHLTKIILDYLIPKIRDTYKLYAIATDGSYNLYSAHFFHIPGFKPHVPMQYEVTFTELRRAGFIEEEDERTIRVMLEPAIDKSTGKIHTISTTEIAKFFESNNGSFKGFNFSPELKHTLEAACNAFVRSFPNFQYFSVGRSTMVRSDQDPRAAFPLGGGLVAWRGVSANISMGWKPYLNLDIANCAFMLDKPVLDVLKEVIRSPPGDVKSWSQQEYDDVQSFLKSMNLQSFQACKVRYVVDGHTYGGAIRGLGAQSAMESRFHWEEKNRDVSVFDYYRERYGVSLKFPHGPILIIRKSSMVPAELCKIKKGQSYNRKLDGNQTTNMLKFAKKNPNELEKDIEDQVRSMKLKENFVLKELGIQIPDKMLLMDARVLVPPTLRYGQNSRGQIAHINPEGGAWDIWSDAYSFYKTVHVEKWGVLVVGCQNFRGTNDPSLWAFIHSLTKNGSSKGVTFTTDPLVVVDTACRRNFSPEQNKNVLNNIFTKTFSGCQLVVVVLPQKGSPLYGYVKHSAEVDVGILTQCVVERNVISCQDATVQNILLKINSKLGGINHVTVAPFDKGKASQFSSLIMDCPLLILGGDVTHAPPGSKKTVNGKEFIMPSYAAVTGSLDKTCMPFMTEVRAQRKANAGAAEIIQDLQDIVCTMLKTFKARSKVVPRKIIYFRDGVGEGQFPEVLHQEMSAIRKACTQISPQYQPPITFITVQKRHKTRIFYHPVNGRTENAPPGTVIDTQIVHASETDFYLLSHKGMLGTSRPCRYHVLWDDSDFHLDVLQSLAYTLCYMYVRCTKSVKMPAPTYYAHLAAERAKKLCDGFETKYGEPSDANLNKMLSRHVNFVKDYPMHFV